LKEPRRVLSAPGQPRVGSKAHRLWREYTKAAGVSLKRGQRPSVYDAKKHPAFARKLVEIGANDSELAEAFGVAPKTLWQWKAAHKEFLAALEQAEEAQTARVRRALFHKATGYSYAAEKIVVVDDEVVRVPIVEHIPPSDASMRYWLTNRAPREWNAAHTVNLNSSIDVTITKDTSPKDALQAFMKLLGAPASALTIEHEAIAPEPPGDANGSD
jgi:hypothetical protein